jgi:nucleolar protein 58
MSLLTGTRDHAAATSFAGILPEETETEVKEAAKISMGTEISEEDILNIQDLCTQVLDIYEYRTQLHDYLKNRMQAIAPNLSVMVGELVGARLIAHAGSLINLAKYPASTVQILGAEKALFRALKTKHETPKYGLIYHASLVGQAAPKDKGKVRVFLPFDNCQSFLFFFRKREALTHVTHIQISRLVASRSALAIRVDALGENATREIGEEGYQKVEQRLRLLEGGRAHAVSGKGRTQHVPAYDHTKSAKSPAAPRSTSTYNEASDNTMKTETASTTTTPKKEKKDKKKSKKDSDSDDDEMEVESKKDKKDKKKKEKKDKKKGSKISKDEDDGKKKKRKRDDEDTKSEKEKTPKKDKKKKKKTE